MSFILIRNSAETGVSSHKKEGSVKHFRLTVLIAIALLASASLCAQGFSITITVDENCNGRFTNTAGFNSALPCGIHADPGPGGRPNALTYDLLNPPGLVAGDLILVEPGGTAAVTSDIIRFNASSFVQGGTGSLVFYSDNADGVDATADIGFPLALYTNTLTVTEVGAEGANGFTYTPTAGQPGFVAGAAGPVTYVIISDSPAPEPASIGLMLAGLGVLVSRRCLRKKSA